jgi:hypothetical protein
MPESLGRRIPVPSGRGVRQGIMAAALSKGRSTSADKIAYLQNWLTASAEDIEGLRKHGEELQAADAERAAELAAIAYPSELPAPCDDIECWKIASGFPAQGAIAHEP